MGVHMNKILLVILIVTILLLSACSAQEDYEQNEETFMNEVELLDTTVPERKIIYEVNMSMNVRDLEEAIDELRTFIESDEWFDYESISTRSASFVVRIKTERLDNFIETLKGNQTLNSFSKIGTDVSLSYQDASDKILNYQAQYDRLLELYETASLAEMITINQQLSQLEVNIAKEQGIINQFDSLSDYSEVNISFYESVVITQSPFFNRLGSAFVNGFEGLIAFFDGFLIVIATIIPFAIVFVPAGYGIYKLAKLKNKRQNHQIHQRQEDSQSIKEIK
jgi:hypothetical protein